MALAMPVAQAEAVRQVRGAVEFAAADVDLALGGLAEGDDARIEAMDQRAQREQVQRAAGWNVETAHAL